jgi:hypothetical protein
MNGDIAAGATPSSFMTSYADIHPSPPDTTLSCGCNDRTAHGDR